MSSSSHLESSQDQPSDDYGMVESFIPDVHCNLISFLSLVQRHNFRFIIIVWNALDNNAQGGTSKVSESTIDIARKFAFKRSILFAQDRTRAFRALISEVFILGHPLVRHHPNIIDLEGICFELDDNETLNPVLVFEKAPRGSLDNYLRSVEGRESSFDTRRKLCIDIGNAIACLHGAHIIHGDITPQNILVVKDNRGHLIAKMIDFGSSWAASTEDEVISFPRCWPWYAPELEYDRRLKLQDAMRAEIYSFGMVCLYTLFHKHFDGDSSSSSGRERDGVWKLSQWKALKDDIISKVDEVLDDVDETLKISLRTFFQSTLSYGPESRNTDFKTLIAYLSEPTSTTIDWYKNTPTSDECVSISFHADFRLARSVYALNMFYNVVQKRIQAALQAMATDQVNGEQLCVPCQLNASFQLALCYRLGFGVDPDISEAKRWLGPAENMDALEREVELVKQMNLGNV